MKSPTTNTSQLQNITEYYTWWRRLEQPSVASCAVPPLAPNSTAKFTTAYLAHSMIHQWFVLICRYLQSLLWLALSSRNQHKLTPWTVPVLRRNRHNTLWQVQRIAKAHKPTLEFQMLNSAKKARVAASKKPSAEQNIAGKLMFIPHSTTGFDPSS